MSNSRLSALGGSTRLCALAAAPATLAEADAWNRVEWNLTEIPSRYSHSGISPARQVSTEGAATVALP